MSRAAKVAEYYVRVEPDIGWMARGAPPERRIEATKQECETIMAAIDRHVDGVRRVELVAELEHVCSHCGAAWTEAPDSPHNGGCCGKDNEATESRKDT